MDELGDDIVPKLVKELGAAEWSARCEAIAKLQMLVESKPEETSTVIVKLMSPFVPCLTDSNSKVCIHQQHCHLVEKFRCEMVSSIAIIVILRESLQLFNPGNEAAL